MNFSRDFSALTRYPAGMNDPQLFSALENPDVESVAHLKPARGPLRLRKVDRTQVMLMARCLEELLESDHQARTIWAVVQRLDVTEFCSAFKARGESPGRAPNDPRVLIALWLYATTMGEGSARKVCRLCTSDDGYRWICGGLSMNYHSLADFRVGHAEALDKLFTQVIARLVDLGLIDVHRISQDGTRVRAMAGLSSYASEERLNKLLIEAKAHVTELAGQLNASDAGGRSARQKAAMKRAAREKQQRLEAALAQIPLIQAVADKPKNRAKSKRNQAKGKKIRASRTDAQARKMRMADGGTRPAYNVQLAVDTASRAVVGIDVTNVGSDNAEALPMRKQVQQRAQRLVREHLLDGGFMNADHINQSHADNVAIYMTPSNRNNGVDPFAPRKKDSPGMAAWRERMANEKSKAIYQQRASTIETVNGDFKTHRGLEHIQVRGMDKVKTVAVWAGLAYNLMHFGKALLN